MSAFRYQPTPKDRIKLHAEVMELYYCAGLSISDISFDTGLQGNHVVRIINKYKPRQTSRDIIITLRSKV